MRFAAIAFFAASVLPVGAAWADGDYTIALSAQDLSYIGGVLGKQPYNDVRALLEKLQGQIDKENTARAAAATPPAGAPPDVKK